MLGKRRIPQQTKYRKRRTNPALRMPEGTFAGTRYNPKKPLKRWRPPGAELKDFDTGENMTTLVNASTAQTPAYTLYPSLNLIQEGTADGEREGNRITVDKLAVRLEFNQNKNSNATFNNLVDGNPIYRVIIAVDTQPNGAAPPISKIFDTDRS